MDKLKKQKNEKTKNRDKKGCLPDNKKIFHVIKILTIIFIIALFIILSMFVTDKLNILNNKFISKTSKPDYTKENIQSMVYNDAESLNQVADDNVIPAKGEILDVEKEFQQKQAQEYAELKVQLEKVTEDIRQINENVSSADIKIADMEKDIQSLKMNNYLVPLAVSIIELRDTINKGENFEEAIDNIEYLANGNMVILTALDKIKIYSEGIKSGKHIEKKFFEIVEQVMQDTRKPGENANWIEQTKYNLTKSIIIRKVDKSKNPSELENILIDAEAYINDNDYESALYEIGKLDNKQKKFFDEWIKNTAEYLYVNNIINGLMKYMREL